MMRKLCLVIVILIVSFSSVYAQQLFLRKDKYQNLLANSISYHWNTKYYHGYVKPHKNALSLVKNSDVVGGKKKNHYEPIFIK